MIFYSNASIFHHKPVTKNQEIHLIMDLKKMRANDGSSSALLLMSRSTQNRHFRNFFMGFSYLLIFILLSVCILFFFPFLSSYIKPYSHFNNPSLEFQVEVQVPNTTISQSSQGNCTYYTCFDVYKCSHTRNGKIKVYVYPTVEYVDEDGVPITKKITKEFYRILKTIINSQYFTSDPNEACVFIPSIDLLNQNRIRPKEVGKALALLPQ